MGAFEGAVGAGAHAIETDLRLTADGVVVLSHDSSLKRCFGVDKHVKDSSWDYLSTLKTIREPQQHMPRLLDLLRWLAKDPELENIWVRLDIKTDDKPEDLMRGIADALAACPGRTPWEERIVLGCWNARFFEEARRVLPTYPVAIISWSLPYARHFLPVPNVGFNIMQPSLVGPLGAWFLRAAKRAGRPVFTWTVNEEKRMEWCLRKNLGGEKKGEAVIDGVITDR
jgi:phosphatidylglycerol phospholipase C